MNRTLTAEAVCGRYTVVVEPAGRDVKRTFPEAEYINKDGVWVSVFARKNKDDKSKINSDRFLIDGREYKHVATILYSELNKKAKKKRVVEQMPLFDI